MRRSQGWRDRGGGPGRPGRGTEMTSMNDKLSSPPVGSGAQGALLAVEGLSKRFEKTEVLRSVDFAITQGETVCVVGPNGSGKTTLLRCLNLLISPTLGKLYFPRTAHRGLDGPRLAPSRQGQ